MEIQVEPILRRFRFDLGVAGVEQIMKGSIALLEEARGSNNQFCHFVGKKEKDISFIFNENKSAKVRRKY